MNTLTLESPYRLVGATLVANGYSVIPIAPGEKRPDPCLGTEWPRYCSRLPTKLEIENWSARPVGVGVALGAASRGLVAIDIDSNEVDVIEAIESRWPSTVRKVGRKGYSAFYWASPAVKSRAFKSGTHGGVDFLAHGRQTILPPTRHKDTGEAYRWLTPRTLENTVIDELPMLPDDIAAQLAEALEPFGFEASPERRALVREPVGTGDSIWDDVKAAALANLDCWVGDLGIGARREGASWRGVAIWRDGKNHNVSFHPNGIKDYGDGEKGYNAIEVTMKALDMNKGEALDWLKGKLGFEEPQPVHFDFRKPGETPAEWIAAEAPRAVEWLEEAARFITAALAVTETPDNFVGGPEADSGTETDGIPVPALDPFDHTVAGGLLQTVAEWIMSTSFVPSRELSLIAAIGIMAAFISRRYVGPTFLSPNLYLVGLASTGAGKDAPLSAVKAVFVEHGSSTMRGMLGSGDLTSGPAIQRLVRARPASISPIDEIGAWMQDGSGRNAAAFARTRRKAMLELYTSSRRGSTYLGRDSAGEKDMSSDTPIHSPCFSILGMSTEEAFFKGLTEENLSDGTLNRLTVIHIPPVEERRRRMEAPEMPQDLKMAFDAAFEAWSIRDPIGRTGFARPEVKPVFHVVPYAGAAAEAAFDSVWHQQQALIKDDRNNENLYKRMAEQTLKLAMIRAVSRDFANPAVTVEDVAFGKAIVWTSTKMLREGLKRYMSGSDFEDACKTMLRHVEDAGQGGLPRIG